MCERSPQVCVSKSAEEALLWSLDQELLDEVFGHGAGLAEVAVIKLIEHPHNVA